MKLSVATYLEIHFVSMSPTSAIRSLRPSTGSLGDSQEGGRAGAQRGPQVQNHWLQCPPHQAGWQKGPLAF